MDELLEILSDCIPIFNGSVLEIGSTQYKHEQDSKMDIENPNILPDNSIDESMYSTQDSGFELLFFDRVSDSYYSEVNDSKIANLKMNSVSLRRKDQIFKRYKREQQQKILQRRKQLQQNYQFNENQLKFQGEFIIKKNEKKQIFAFKAQDFQKLRPQTDLNDTIIDNYLKLMQITLIPQDISQKTFIFSTFFMGKLLGELKEDTYIERENESSVQKIVRKVAETYSTMKRWTKKIDLFEKQYLIVPINAYKHWNCMIIVSPHALLTEPGQCKIFYLDSMFEKKSTFPQAIKTFLELELSERKDMKMSLENVATYQLLVPRQTNSHDCGLYTICYIEHFLKNYGILEQNMDIIENRYQLRIFPRSLIFTMRQLLRRLFKNLLTKQDKDQVILQYIHQREQIEKNSTEFDYDTINQRQFKKYHRFNSHLYEDKKKSQQQIEYLCLLKFYLDCEINYYEKDQIEILK